jgi:hypothetical protein
MSVVGDKLLFLIPIYCKNEKPGHVTAKCSVERWLAARPFETPHRPSSSALAELGTNNGV